MNDISNNSKPYKKFILDHFIAQSQMFSEEYFHCEFPDLLNIYSQYAKTKPILLKGDFNSGKKTMVRQLCEILGVEPRIYDLSHSTINNEPYFDQKLLIDDLRLSQANGAFIIIKDYDKLDTYDNCLLTAFFIEIKDSKNPKSTIIILENNAKQYFRNLTNIVRQNSAIITISKDQIIESKLKKVKNQKEIKQKIK